jgi:hypothetical protein
VLFDKVCAALGESVKCSLDLGAAEVGSFPFRTGAVPGVHNATTELLLIAGSWNQSEGVMAALATVSMAMATSAAPKSRSMFFMVSWVSW